MRGRFGMSVAAFAAVALIAAGACGAGSGGKGATGGEFGSVTVTGAPLDTYPGNFDVDPAVDHGYAPEVEGRDFSGRAVRIGAEVGTSGHKKIVLLVSHWCPDCRKQLPILASWLGAAALPDDVTLYLVATSTDPKQRNYPPSNWIANADLRSVRALVDDVKGSAAEAYGFGMISNPSWVFLDEANDVMGRYEGGLTLTGFGDAMALLEAGELVQLGTATSTTTSPSTTTTTETPPSVSTTTETPPTEAPTGTSWQDLVALIGHGWQDADVYRLVSECGAGNDVMRSGNIACIDSGFELTLDSDLRVSAVTLFGGDDSGYATYQGSLPGGLAWSDGPDTIISTLGQPANRWGGNGVSVEFEYSLHGYDVKVDLTALHDNPEDLAGATIYSIGIAPLGSQ